MNDVLRYWPIILGFLSVLWGGFNIQRNTEDNRIALVAITTRADAQDKTIAGIDKNGTDFGRNKVDTRMAEIAEVKASEKALEERFTTFLDNFQPKFNTMADHVEQMWGEYRSPTVAPPSRVDPRKLSRN